MSLLRSKHLDMLHQREQPMPPPEGEPLVYRIKIQEPSSDLTWVNFAWQVWTGFKDNPNFHDNVENQDAYLAGLSMGSKVRS